MLDKSVCVVNRFGKRRNEMKWEILALLIIFFCCVAQRVEHLFYYNLATNKVSTPKRLDFCSRSLRRSSSFCCFACCSVFLVQNLDFCILESRIKSIHLLKANAMFLLLQIEILTHVSYNQESQSLDHPPSFLVLTLHTQIFQQFFNKFSKTLSLSQLYVHQKISPSALLPGHN